MWIVLLYLRICYWAWKFIKSSLIDTHVCFFEVDSLFHHTGLWWSVTWLMAFYEAFWLTGLSFLLRGFLELLVLLTGNLFVIEEFVFKGVFSIMKLNLFGRTTFFVVNFFPFATASGKKFLFRKSNLIDCFWLHWCR